MDINPDIITFEASRSAPPICFKHQKTSKECVKNFVRSCKIRFTNHNDIYILILQEIFGADVPAHKPHGILNVEHCGKPPSKHDGFCCTILVTFRVPLEEVYPIDKYSWVMVSKEVGDQLLSRLPRNLTVPLNVIR